MTSIAAAARRIPALRATQEKYIATNLRVLDELDRICQAELASAEGQGGEGGGEGGAAPGVDAAGPRLDAASKQLSDNFKEYHAQISKLTKELDKVRGKEGRGGEGSGIAVCYWLHCTSTYWLLHVLCFHTHS
jgi:hypothetical protein